MADAPRPAQGADDGELPAAEVRRGRPGRPRRATPRHASAPVARHRLRKLRSLLPGSPDLPEPSEPPPPPQELIAFLRVVGATLVRAGESVDAVQETINRLGARYGFDTVHTFVVPTGVFVRAGKAPDSVIDFAPVQGPDLRLDQIDQLYRFIDEVYAHPVAPEAGTARLAEIEAMRPRFGFWTRVLGYVVMTMGLGLLTLPNSMALAGYAVLGLVVGMLREYADRAGRLVNLALPVLAALLVTAVAYRYSGPLLGEDPTKLLIPPLVAFLPGTALTMGTIELATGSIVSGASRLVYGLNVLILLAFGIAVGSQLVTEHPLAKDTSVDALGAWAAWAGVGLLGLGFVLSFSASLRTLPWLLLVLCVAKVGQDVGTTVAGPLFGAFAGGVTLPLLTRLIERNPHAPPAQVVFLPAFWMLVPGRLGLTGVGQLLVDHENSGLDTTVEALLTVVAVALGVLVGANALNRRTVPVPAEPGLPHPPASSAADPFASDPSGAAGPDGAAAEPTQPDPSELPPESAPRG
ncbi:threonine/serine ThrE exporter family protein [Streptomyces mesophilus]|uniref:threonine/serine ThrE exporter family protein n=1 Tax=Streptomyces mesophilus TaxID=1775132 RepID=UPI003329F42B